MIEKIKQVVCYSVLRNALRQFGQISAKKLILYAALGIGIVFIITIMKKKKPLLRDLLTGIVLSIYGSIMLQLTLVCREPGSRIGIELNLFHGMFEQEVWLQNLMLAYILLNCMLFIPFGFTISLFSFVDEKRPVIQFVTILLVSFMASMTIECTQLLTGRGYFEVQDILVNTLGGLIGWLLFRLIDTVGTFVKTKCSKEQ